MCKQAHHVCRHMRTAARAFYARSLCKHNGEFRWSADNSDWKRAALRLPLCQYFQHLCLVGMRGCDDCCAQRKLPCIFHIPSSLQRVSHQRQHGKHRHMAAHVATAPFLGASVSSARAKTHAIPAVSVAETHLNGITSSRNQPSADISTWKNVGTACTLGSLLHTAAH